MIEYVEIAFGGFLNWASGTSALNYCSKLSSLVPFGLQVNYCLIPSPP